MLLRRELFGSRVARRVFLLFVLASLVPLGALAWLVRSEMAAALEERAYEALAWTARVQGQLLLDRLLTAEQALGRFEATVAHDASQLDAVLELTARGSHSLQGAHDVLPDGWEPAVSRRAEIVLAHTPAADARVLIAKPGDDGWHVGRVEQGYLWEITEQRPYGVEICVLAARMSAPLYCSSGMPSSAIESAASGGEWQVGRLTLRHGKEAWLAAYWELFVDSRFEGDSWWILVSQPRSLALESLHAFDRTVPPVVGIAVVLIVLLSAAQLRRTLEPLEQLVTGTRRIAERDFAATVQVESGDEFADLAAALNRMAEQLGRQFDTLRTLAEVDRLILSSLGLDGTLQRVIARSARVVPGGRLALLLFDNDGDAARWFEPAEGAQPQPVPRPVQLTSQQRERLCSERRARLMNAATAGSLLGLPIPGAEHPAAILAPIADGAVTRGVLLLTFPAGVDEEAVLDSARELASRVAVAVTAAEREQELLQRAHFDSLTGLPNRRFCGDRLNAALEDAHRGGHDLAVLFLDLDGFKQINDSLGHSTGDRVLHEIGVRLRNVADDSATVGRFGGDEYVVVLPRVAGESAVDAAAERIASSFAAPFVVEGREAFITASIGAALFPQHGSSAEELIRRADTAMHAAKEQGRARRLFFTPAMERRAHARLSLQTDLRKAVERGELTLVYQAQTDLRTGRIMAAEALLRWQHETRGAVSPAEFVPALEDMGLIEAVGAWVLRAVLDDFLSWRRAGVRLERIGVNIAARQLFEPGFCERLEHVLTSRGLPADCLELELTEGTFVQDFERSNAVLNVVRAMGVRVAIDDFGTGYSSLGYLKDLDFDTLKVDRAFVSSLPNEKSVAIVKAVLAVAQTLEKTVIAEGIETVEQKLHLARLGCIFGQGFLFAPPLRPAAFFELLATGAQPDGKTA